MMPSCENIIERIFLVRGLPEPLKPADSHLQISDNYIEKTRIRTRRIRVPGSKQWTSILEQIIYVDSNNFCTRRLSQIYLNKAEFSIFKPFQGREVRKNRYSYTIGDTIFDIDIFLGRLYGLNIAKTNFESEEDAKNFQIPDFAVEEISHNEFFLGENLVEKAFSDLKQHFSGSGLH